LEQLIFFESKFF